MPITRRALAGLAALIVLPLAACGANATSGTSNSPASSGGPIEVKHAQGTLTLDGPAKRVVVLELGSLDTIAAVGAQDVVAGVPKGSALPGALSEFNDDKYQDVGTFFEPNIEAIQALKPDLVIAGFRSAKAYGELSKHFPTIDVTYERSNDFVGDVTRAADIVGKALGKTAEVETQLAEVKEAMDAAKGKAPSGASALILMTSAGKVSLSGADSRFGLIHSDLGFKPAISEAEAQANSHGEAISFEAIAEANPEWMFVVDRDAAIGEDGAAAKQVLDNDLVKGTKAWSSDKVVYLDGTRWYIVIHGVNNSVEMLKEVTAALR